MCQCGPITNMDYHLLQVAGHKKPRLEDSLGRRMEAGPGQEVEGAGDSHGRQIDIYSSLLNLIFDLSSVDVTQLTRPISPAVSAPLS